MRKAVGRVRIIDKKHGSSPNDSWFLRINAWEYSPGTINKLDFSVIDLLSVQHTIYSNSTLNINTWYHVVAMIDASGNMSLYINGVKQALTTTTPSIFVSTDFLRVGAAWSGGERLDGIIEEIRMYSRVLSDAEILEHYQNIFNNESSLICWYELNEGQGSLAYDSSGNENILTFYGPTWTPATEYPINSVHTYQTALVSGVWNRFELPFIVASGVYSERVFASISGAWLRIDDMQLEESDFASDYLPDFIGDLILPKRAIKAHTGFNNFNIPKFTGLTNRIAPNLKENIVEIHAYDWANRLKDIQITETYYENKRTDEIIQALASIAGIGENKLSLETGELTIEFAWFKEGSIWTYMNQVAEAEGGRIFFDEEGILTFWSRMHYHIVPDPVYTFTFDKNISDFKFEVSNANVKNVVNIKANPQKKLIDKKIFTLDNARSIESKKVEEFFCQYNYGTEVSVPALNVQLPIIGTDILANTLEDGTGSNISSSISISSYYIFSESIRLNLLNSNAATAYITKLDVYGDPIVIKKYIEITKEDTNSINLYNEQILNIENNFISSESYANTLAMQRLAELKDPLDFASIEVIGVPYLKCGDIVSVQRSFDGTMDNFYVIRNRWQLDGDFTQKLDLIKKVII
jgi:hypothetical protein